MPYYPSSNTPGMTGLTEDQVRANIAGFKGDNPVTPADAQRSSVGMITTDQGISELNKVKTKENLLKTSSVPPTTTPGTTTTPKTTAPLKEPTKVTLINPATAQEITFDNADTNRENIQKYLDSGYALGSASGAIPSWLSPSGTKEKTKAESQAEDALAERDEYQEKLKNLDVSNDPLLSPQIAAITSQWNTRIAEMEKINKSRTANISTTAIRLGSRYTGGAGGVSGGIITEEERQGVQRVAELESQKQGAIAAATLAFRNQKWNEYAKFIDLAESKYQDAVKEVDKLNTKALEQNKLIMANRQLEEKEKYDRVTKPINDVLLESVKLGAPKEIQDAISGSETLSEAVAAAGDYLQGGSGIVGEYNFYKKDALARGQNPVSFNTYQDMDANRKIRIAASGLEGSNLNTKEAAIFNSLVDKYNKSPLVAAYDRTIVLQDIIKNVKADPSNGAQQLSLAYGFIQALDSYQSSVREGELSLVNSIDSKVGKLQNSIDQITKGQIVRPEVVEQIANAALQLVETIQTGAKQKQKTFAAQASQNGKNVKGAFEGYLGAVNSIPPTGSGLTQSEDQAKTTVNNFYVSSSPETQSAIDGLVQSGKTNTDIVEYLKAKNLLK